MPRLKSPNSTGIRSVSIYRSPQPNRWLLAVSLLRGQRSFTSRSRSFISPPRNESLKSPADAPLTSNLFSAAPERRVEGFGGADKDGDPKPPDERLLKLGKNQLGQKLTKALPALRILSPLLPTILINPLPAEILSPHVALHLFPSTHPHLPNIKGRVLYRAALWTVPVAWSSVPLVGNVRLKIQSERMFRSGCVLGTQHEQGDCGEERLIVRWKTEAKKDNKSSSSSSSSSSTTTTATRPSSTSGPDLSDSTSVDALSDSLRSSSKTGTNKSLSTLLGGEAPIFKPSKEGQFSGLFVFAFDEEGRIASHTIEHADQANGWDRTAKFVTLTDWLLGKARGSIGPDAAGPSLAAQGCNEFEWNSQITTSRSANYRSFEGTMSSRRQ